METALVLIGAILVVTGLQGTQGALASQLSSDLSGAGSFWYFIAGISAAGALGYYAPLSGASKLLLFLIVLVLLLSNQGFFAQLQAAVAGAGSVAGPVAPALPVPTASSGTSPVPGLSSNPFAGLPTGLTAGSNPFLSFPSLTPGPSLLNPGSTTGAVPGADIQSLP